MAFKDYSATPASNTALGDGTYIGPNMLRNKVRPALQQIAADGRELYDEVVARGAGGTLPAFVQAGTGAIERSAQTKLREITTPNDFGAVGTGFAGATEHAGFEAGIAALANPNDAFFNGSLAVPNGNYSLTAPIDLPQSFGRVYGSPRGLIRGAAGQHIFRADGPSFVSSNFARMSLYGGLNSINAGTGGEIAQLSFSEMYVGAHTGSAFYFAGHLTSSRIDRVTVDGVFSTSGHALHSDGGQNNNNVLSDCDFFNVPGDVVRIETETNGLQARNIHIEGRGQAGAAQYHLEAPAACHILGGWSESSHEYLVRTTAQPDPMAAGVIIDGLVSVGSVYGGGSFVGSKFDTGTNRVIIGSNFWSQVTTAPLVCFIYGANRNLRTNDSTVWTRDTGTSFRVTTAAKRATGTSRVLILTLTRGSAVNTGANQQVFSARFRVNFGGYNASPTPVYGIIEWQVSVRAIGSAITAPVITKVMENDGYSGAGVTATCVAGTPTSTAVVVTITVASLHPTLEAMLQAEIEGVSTSFTEADRFALSVA
jgi:hypothetical protein